MGKSGLIAKSDPFQTTFEIQWQNKKKLIDVIFYCTFERKVHTYTVHNYIMRLYTRCSNLKEHSNLNTQVLFKNFPLLWNQVKLQKRPNERLLTSNITRTLGGSDRRSPLGRVSSLLSSKTEFKFSTHSGSTSPSNMIHWRLLISPRTLSMIFLNIFLKWNNVNNVIIPRPVMIVVLRTLT